MITKVEAVVLKSMNFRDSSKIVTLYSREFGKIKGIAKGARQMKNKFGAALQPITVVSVVMYKKENRELQLISQCDALRIFKQTHSDLERMAVALSVLELVNQVAHGEERHDALYELLVETLEVIEKAGKNKLNLLYAFEIRMASMFGFTPDLSACTGCGRAMDDLVPDGSALVSLSRGAVVCQRCSDTVAPRIKGASSFRGAGNPSNRNAAEDGTIRVSVGALKALHRLLTARLDSLPLLDLGATGGNEIDGTLRLYLRQHFEDLKPLKSLDILKKFSVLHS